jgi:hypothetical protein
MKEKIDKIFEKSLEGHEMPYDSKAWEAMSKKLNQTMPTNGGSNLKWYLGGAAVIGIAVSAALFMNNEEKKEIAQEAKSKTEVSSDASNDVAVNSNGTSETANGTSQNSTEKEGTTDNGLANNSNLTADVNSNDVAQHTNTNQTTDNTTYTPQNQYKPQNNSQTPDRVIDVILPEINAVCKGEIIKIDNRNNEVSIYVIDPSGNRTTIKAESKGTFKTTEDGQHFIAQITDGKIVKKEAFQVLPLPQVDMSYDEVNKFENGIPTTKMTSGSIGTSFEWDFGANMETVYGKSVEAHYFKDDIYTVTLTVTGSNGCKASESMKVNIENDYKLMATNSFNPNSTNDINRTFMPYGLTERNTEFTLMIIEPSTGNVIYETNDISQPWTGVDRRNGQMVEFNKSFVWKVVLKNPMKGERSDYAGSVVLTSFR